MSEEVDVQVEKIKGITGSTVKIIAIVTMLIDHIGAVVVERYMESSGMNDVIYSQDISEWFADFGAVYILDVVLRCIGRMGFPLFIFLLVEGFKYTHSKLQYVIRLAIFALISELPFNLAVGDKLFYPEYQSVFVTLLLGFLFMCWDDFIKKQEIKKNFGIAGIIVSALGASWWVITQINGWRIPETTKGKLIVTGMLVAFTVLIIGIMVKMISLKGREFVIHTGVSLVGLVVLMYAADFLRTDYGGLGVLAIATAYAFRKEKALCISMCCLVLTVFNFIEVFAFFDLFVIINYNGKKGAKIKYLFYAFYPVHLFILHVISHLLGFGSGHWWGF